MSLFAKLFALFAVVLSLITLILLLPAFRIDHVEITGNTDLTEQDIKKIIDIEIGRHAFLDLGPEFMKVIKFRYGDIESELLSAYPELATVEARFSWPSGILVQLQERVETACIRYGFKYALVDRDGYVIRFIDDAPEYLPVIEGMANFETLEPGDLLSENDRGLLTTATEIAAQLILIDQAYPDDASLLALTRSISPENHGFAFLILQFDTNNVWRVKVSNDRTLSEDIRKLQELVTSDVLLEKGSGQLDLTTDKIVFRKDNP
ncbi:MAG TPA: FtsQ-type POTRA domain-containing protein [Clostridiaceae bacterium]|nr:FtsQ-type POTRA domain-containing protein [Clostridiaceae bacterium]